MNNNKLLLDTLELFEGTIYRLLDGGKSILYDLDNPSKFLEDRAKELKKMEEERGEKVKQLSDNIKLTGKEMEKQVREIITQKMRENYSNTKKAEDIQYLLSKRTDLNYEDIFDIERLNDILKQKFRPEDSLKLEERSNNPLATETPEAEQLTAAQNPVISDNESVYARLLQENHPQSDDLEEVEEQVGQEQSSIQPPAGPQTGGRRKRTSKKLRKRKK